MRSHSKNLPVGKLPVEMLASLLSNFGSSDRRLVVGPGVGLDCAVVRVADRLLVLKSDPITFVTEDIGEYLVQVNANDLATTGAQPRWLLLTMLLPEGGASAKSVYGIAKQVQGACRSLGVSIIGGHTEVTHGLARPILFGTLIGEVEPAHLITPRGARPGDRLLLTKGVPIEATAILAREFSDRLARFLRPAQLRQARSFLHNPGISVVADARIALRAGRVTAMHDLTEGGLVLGLWELAHASGRRLCFDPAAVPVPPLAAQICQALKLDPLRAIASGALLLTASPPAARGIRRALKREGIVCAEIGKVEPGSASVWRISQGECTFQPPSMRDEIARLFEFPYAPRSTPERRRPPLPKVRRD